MGIFELIAGVHGLSVENENGTQEIPQLNITVKPPGASPTGAHGALRPLLVLLKALGCAGQRENSLSALIRSRPGFFIVMPLW